MITYIVFFIFIFFVSIIELLVENIWIKKLFFTFVASLFFLLIAFRQTGYDYNSYFEIFENIKQGLDVFNIEPGFIFICQLCDSFRGLLIVIAFVTILLHMTFIYKTSELPFISLLVLSTTYLFPTFMGQMRQGLAMGIVIWSVYFIRDKRILFFLLIILACFIHSSAIIALVFLVLPKTVRNLKYYVYTLLIALVASFILEPFFSKLLSLFPYVMAIDKLTFYSETEDYKLGFNFAIMIRLFVFCFAYYFKDKIKDQLYPILLNIYFYSIVLYLALGFVPQLGGRGTLYFAYFDIILIPMIIKASTRYQKIFIISIVLLLAISRFTLFFYSDFNYEQYVPYLKGELYI